MLSILRQSFLDKANSDDPNEISFEKSEILEILDKQGKWWQAKKADGSVGSECRVILTTWVRRLLISVACSCTIKLLAVNMICIWTLSFSAIIYSRPP